MEPRIITDTRLFQYAKKETTPFRLFIQKFKHDWSLVYSGMLAFNLLIAILPMAITLFGILGLVLGNHPDLRNRIRNHIVNAFPPKANDGIREIINMAFKKLYQDAGIILAFGLIFAIIGSSRLFVAIDRCLTIIYRIEERKFLKKNLLAIGMLFLFLILIPLMILASSTPSLLLDVIPNAGGRFGTYLAGLLLSLFFSFLLFELIYLIIPNKKMTFKQTWCGAIVAAGALQLFMILFPLYVKKSMASYTGQIGFAIILLLFLFYAAIILILGAQINAFCFEHIQPLPVSLGTFVSTLANEYHEKEAREPLNI
jgi:YihY family inner membrane protein